MPDVAVKVKIQSEGQQQLSAIKQQLSGVTSEVKLSDASLKALDATNVKLSTSMSELSKQLAQIREGLKSTAEESRRSNESMSRSIDASRRSVTSLSDEIGTLLGRNNGLTAGTLASAAGITALGSAAAITLKSIFALAEETGRLAEEQANTSERTGLSIRDVGIFSQIANNAGVNAHAFTGAVKTLSLALSENSDEGKKAKRAINELGVETTNQYGGQKSAGELWRDIGAALQGIEDPAKRAREAVAIFGRSGVELLPALRGNLRETAAELEQLGVGFSTDGAKAAQGFDNTLDRLNTNLGVFKRRLGELAATKLEGGVALLAFLASGGKDFKALGIDVNKIPKNFGDQPIALAPGENPDGTDKYNIDNTPASALAAEFRNRLVPAGPSEADLNATLRTSRVQQIRGFLNGRADIGEQIKQAQSELAEAEKAADLAGVQAAAARIDLLEKKKQSAIDYKKELAEIKKLEGDLSKLREEADLKPYGEIGRIELRRRNKVSEIESALPAGAKRDQLVEDFNRAFGKELADAAAAAAEKLRVLGAELDKASLTIPGAAGEKLLMGAFKQNLKEVVRERREDDQLANQSIRFTGQRFDEQGRYLQRRNEALAGPGDELAVTQKNLGIELQILDKRRAAEIEIAQRELEGHELRMRQNEIERQYEADTLKAREDTELRIIDLRRRATEQSSNQLYALLTGRISGQDFLKSQADIVGKNGFDRLMKDVGGPLLGKLGAATGLGGLLKGTILDTDQAATPAIRATDRNTAALENLTLALGGGLGVTGSSGLDALLLRMPGATPPFADSQDDSSSSGGGSFLGRVFGKTKSASGDFSRGTGGIYSKDGPGLFGGFSRDFEGSKSERAGNLIGSAAVVAGGAMGVAAGIKEGGPRGAVGAVGSALTVASAIPGPQQPFVAAAALVAGLVKGLLPDPKVERENQIRDEVSRRKYTAPTAIDRAEDLAGNQVGYDAEGGVRRTGMTVIQQFNVSAMDVKGFLDRSDDIAAAARKALRDGNDGFRVAIQNAAFGT